MSETELTYPKCNPYLTVKDAAKAIAFYRDAFGARERFRLTDPVTGKIGHAELLVDEALFMLAEEDPQYNTSPQTLGGTSVKLNLMVDDADRTFEAAVRAGAEVIMPPTDMFYGFRNACVRDPFGHEWMIQHRIGDVAPEEMQSRWEAILRDGKESTNENTKKQQTS